jgi:glycosyltransferase involved in cell wall biosynthesis
MTAMDSTPPRVSVVMTVGRDLRFLDEAVESILCQDFRDFEFIIVDDGTGEHALFNSLAERDPRIRVLTNATNLGTPASTNRGIAASGGEIIVRLDADDIAEPTRIRHLVAALDSEPELGLVGSWGTAIDEQGKPKGLIQYPPPDLEIRWTNLFFIPFIHSSVAFRRRCFDATPGYRTDQPISHDGYLWADMLEITRARNIPELLVRYRLNPRGLTASGDANWRARGDPMREKSWARLGLRYDLYGHERADHVARFLTGSGDIPEAQARLAACRTVLTVLHRFLSVEAPKASAEGRQVAKRLRKTLVKRVLAQAPQDLTSRMEICRLIWPLDRRAAVVALAKALWRRIRFTD